MLEFEITERIKFHLNRIQYYPISVNEKKEFQKISKCTLGEPVSFTMLQKIIKIQNDYPDANIPNNNNNKKNNNKKNNNNNNNNNNNEKNDKINEDFKICKYIHELMKGSKPYFEPEKPKPKDPKKEKWLQQLRHEYENRQYQKMVRNVVVSKKMERIENSMHMKSFGPQLQIGVNILITMITCFVGGWFLGKSYFGDQVLGLCVGIIFTIIALLVEMWLFIISGSSLENHLKKEETRKKKGKVKSKILPDIPGLAGY